MTTTIDRRKRSDALRAYRGGRPSLLPESNPYKRAVEAHRWGAHYAGPRVGCPVCEEGGKQ